MKKPFSRMRFSGFCRMRSQPDAAKRCELEILLERVTILKSLKSRLSSKSGRGGCLYNFQRRLFDKAFCLSPKGDPDLFVINKQPWVSGRLKETK